MIDVKAGALSPDVITQAMYYAAQINKFTLETLESKIHAYPANDNKDLKTMLRDRGLDTLGQEFI